jgi:hypothetical protein
MVVVPLAKPVSETSFVPVPQSVEPNNWIRYAAAGTLAASGVLLVTGHRRAGLIAAASGAALALLEKEAVTAWWNGFPGFLEELSATLCRAQSAVEDISTQGHKLRETLGRYSG